MRLKIKVLSPLHIGSGEEISPLEYIFHDGKFIRLDMESLFNDTNFQPHMDKFIRSAKYQRYIKELLPLNLLLKYPLYTLDVSSSENTNNPRVVKEFIKSLGRVYIPGSSLKGSILSGVIYKIALQKNIKNLRDYESLISQVLEEVSTKKNLKKFSPWLVVEDSNLLPPEESLQISPVRVTRHSGEQSGFFILYETVKKGIEFTTSIRTSLNSVLSFGKYSEKEILQMADEFYRRVYEKERKSRVNPSLPSLPARGYLLRLGQGSTCLSTSLLLTAEALGIKGYKIYRPRIRGRELSPISLGGEPSTRKLVGSQYSMGWVEVVEG